MNRMRFLAKCLHLVEKWCAENPGKTSEIDQRLPS